MDSNWDIMLFCNHGCGDKMKNQKTTIITIVWIAFFTLSMIPNVQALISLPFYEGFEYGEDFATAVVGDVGFGSESARTGDMGCEIYGDTETENYVYYGFVEPLNNILGYYYFIDFGVEIASDETNILLIEIETSTIGIGLNDDSTFYAITLTGKEDFEYPMLTEQWIKIQIVVDLDYIYYRIDENLLYWEENTLSAQGETATMGLIAENILSEGTLLYLDDFTFSGESILPSVTPTPTPVVTPTPTTYIDYYETPFWLGYVLIMLAFLIPFIMIAYAIIITKGFRNIFKTYKIIGVAFLIWVILLYIGIYILGWG